MATNVKNIYFPNTDDNNDNDYDNIIVNTHIHLIDDSGFEVARKIRGRL